MSIRLRLQRTPSERLTGLSLRVFQVKIGETNRFRRRYAEVISLMFDGQLLAIQIADAAAAPMRPLEPAEAVVGRGLIGNVIRCLPE